MLNPNAIPYQPLSLDNMLAPPEELPPPEALFVAETSGAVAPEAENDSRFGQEAAPMQNDAARYMQYGLKGNISEQEVEAIQQALTDTLLTDQERAETLQRVGTEGK